jgi:ABC-type antimicrobial peptide transport system permease subunit
MLLKFKKIIGIAIGVSVGIYLGSVLFAWLDYQNHPDLYALYSAPWYTKIILDSVIAGVIVLLESVVYLLLCYKVKKREM